MNTQPVTASAFLALSVSNQAAPSILTWCPNSLSGLSEHKYIGTDAAGHDVYRCECGHIVYRSVTK
jgi:hypothetical protein